MNPIPVGDLFRLAGITPACSVDSRFRATGVTESTEDLEPGTLFVARKGETHDGHSFLEAAAAKGACAAVVEREVAVDGLPCYRVEDSREALGHLCAAFHGMPSERLGLIGVTGTDGKTTTAHLIASILRASGYEATLITSVGCEYNGEKQPTQHTSPPPPLLQALLAKAAGRNCRYVVMEVSSHAIVQRRLVGCRFLGGVLTNVAVDHLELHPSLRDYREAKKRFFWEYLAGDGNGKDAWQALNMDDPTGRSLRFLEGVRTIPYGLGPGVSLGAYDIAAGKNQIEFCMTFPGGELPVHLPLTGGYNVPNALAAAAAGVACGIAPERIQEGLESFRGVPGRFEFLDANLPFDVVIDYAHTPQAVRAVMEEGRRLSGGRLIAVFSAPGSRWVGKRAEMGEEVGGKADLAFVTTDNPGEEDPAVIAEQIAEGLDRNPPRGGFRIELDRGRAVEQALSAARPGDLVLLLGKGHEEYQIVGGKRIPFSERAIVRRFAGTS